MPACKSVCSTAWCSWSRTHCIEPVRTCSSFGVSKGRGIISGSMRGAPGDRPKERCGCSPAAADADCPIEPSRDPVWVQYISQHTTWADMNSSHNTDGDWPWWASDEYWYGLACSSSSKQAALPSAAISFALKDFSTLPCLVWVVILSVTHSELAYIRGILYWRIKITNMLLQTWKWRGWPRIQASLWLSCEARRWRLHGPGWRPSHRSRHL